VACGNYEEKTKDEGTYAGGADATAIRAALRRTALESWVTASKDVSTAFLNADYDSSQGLIILTPPSIIINAGLMKQGEAWVVWKAIYGLRVSPRLWSLERNWKIDKMTFMVKRKVLSTRRMKADENSWRIIDEADNSVGLINTYVDDILVMSDRETTEAAMSKLDQTWQHSEADFLTEEKDLTFCGRTLKITPQGIILHQKDYIAEVLKRNQADGLNPNMLIFDKEEREGTTTEKDKEELSHEEALTKSQKIARELSWLSTSTRPDLSYPTLRLRQGYF